MNPMESSFLAQDEMQAEQKAVSLSTNKGAMCKLTLRGETTRNDSVGELAMTTKT